MCRAEPWNSNSTFQNTSHLHYSSCKKIQCLLKDLPTSTSQGVQACPLGRSKSDVKLSCKGVWEFAFDFPVSYRQACYKRVRMEQKMSNPLSITATEGTISVYSSGNWEEFEWFGTCLFQSPNLQCTVLVIIKSMWKTGVKWTDYVITVGKVYSFLYN